MPDGYFVVDENGSADASGHVWAPDGAGTARTTAVSCLLGVDPHRSHVVRETVLGMPGGWRVSEAIDGLDAVHLGMSRPFDVLVLDLRLPIVDGYSAAAGICAAGGDGCADVPAVVLIADAVQELPTSLSIGSMRVRVLFRDSPLELVRSALGWIADVLRDQVPASPPEPEAPAGIEPSPRRAGHSPVASLLSARERQVLVSLSRGQSNRQLARALSVTEATVKTHVSRLLAKLGLASRVEAVVYAYENGIVVPGDQCHSA